MLDVDLCLELEAAGMRIMVFISFQSRMSYCNYFFVATINRVKDHVEVALLQ